MSEMMLNINNFEQEVLHSDIPVLVDFWAPWCGPCRMMGPIIERLAEKAEGKYKVGKVNVDEEEELASEFGIMSIPSIKIFINGKVEYTSIGVTAEEKLQKIIENYY